MSQSRHRGPSSLRQAKLFRNDKNQAVRMPADFALPGDRVMTNLDGDRLIIEPLQHHIRLRIWGGDRFFADPGVKSRKSRQRQPPSGSAQNDHGALGVANDAGRR